MKIYRNITLGSIIFILAMATIIPLFFMITGLVTFEELLMPEVIMLIYCLASMMFFVSVGDIAYTRFYKENAGYKYFRSIPNAFERLKKECIRTDIIMLVILMINLVSIFLSEFANFLLLVVYSLSMILFAVFHFANASVKASNRSVLLLKTLSGGIGGMAMTFAAISIEDGKFAVEIPQSVYLIIVLSVTALALISLIPVYTNFKKKWNVD